MFEFTTMIVPLLLATFLSPCISFSIDLRSTSQDVNIWKLRQFSKSKYSLRSSEDQMPFRSLARPQKFEEHWFEQPIDHFDPSYGTYKQRYWVNTRRYLPGVNSPVIVLDGGETSGEDRLPFLDTGIVDILARATNGFGVVLEHRYYGKSLPVQNFTTDSLRFLNNAQAAADSANFMKNAKFDGVDDDLTAPNTPWIYYGGSYAGARAAHMRILYPDIVFGAIASSAVTHADINNWEYMEVIRTASDPKCSSHIQHSIESIDSFLSIPGMSKTIKMLFGLGDLEHDEDFAALLETPLSGWQGKVWDPAISRTLFERFCYDLVKPPFGHASTLSELSFGHPQRSVDIGDGFVLDFAVLNYAKWIRKNIVSLCPKELGVEKCFGTFDGEEYIDTNLDQTWRLWQFQVCTEWGYFIPAPPNPEHARIISNLITLDYESKICRQAFPPGEHFAVPPRPNVTVVNELGDFDITANRLAFIDGEVDPWRPMTPHSQHAKIREDSILQPFKLIPGGVHHWDEWGCEDPDKEPTDIKKVHAEMIQFVIEWLKDF